MQHAGEKKSEQSCNLDFILCHMFFIFCRIFFRIIALSGFQVEGAKFFSVLFCQTYLIWPFTKNSYFCKHYFFLLNISTTY